MPWARGRYLSGNWAEAMGLIAGALKSLQGRGATSVILVGHSYAGHVIPLVADAKIVHDLAELGVIFLMFCLGLELRLRRTFDVVTATSAADAFASCCVPRMPGFARPPRRRLLRPHQVHCVLSPK